MTPFHPKAEHSHQFLQHITSIDSHIQFTADNPNSDRIIPFSDTLVSPGPDNTLLTTVDRKLTHADQCLNGDSHHSLLAQYSTLIHRMRTVCTHPQLLHKKEEHIKGTLQWYNYPNWTLSRLTIKPTTSPAVARTTATATSIW